MHAVLVARKVVLGAFVAFALFVGALFVAAPKASAGLAQCPANAVCVWQNSDSTGNFSWWPASDTGCHSHVNNPNIRSVYNNTANYWVRPGAAMTVPPGAVYSRENPAITGDVCWPA
jgi:hypothetical protein